MGKHLKKLGVVISQVFHTCGFSEALPTHMFLMRKEQSLMIKVQGMSLLAMNKAQKAINYTI